MSFPSLRWPDLPAWRHEAGYSPAVAQVLTQVYRALFQGTTGVRNPGQALELLQPQVPALMAAHQRQHLFYLLGVSLAALGEYGLALACLDEALELAFALHEYVDLVEIFYLRGNIGRNLLALDDAVADYQNCLLLAREFSPGFGPHDAAFELSVVAQLAGLEFYRAHYVQTAYLLREARVLATRVPQQTTSAALIPWMEAHLLRWMGQPERALASARQAADIYTELGSPASAARIQAVAADCALDVAEGRPQGSARAQAIAQAHVHIQIGLSLAREAQDAIGLEFVRLPAVRHNRLAAHNVHRVMRIERIARTAQQLGDEAVLAQAFIALGDEFAAQGERERAGNRYREALRILDGSQLPALAVPARRGLLRVRS